MAVDLSFTVPTTSQVEVPFTVQGYCTGVQALLQKVVIMILSNTRNLLRYEGGNLYANLRSSNLSGTDMARVDNLVNISIAETVEAIRNDQATMTDLPGDERLASISLLGATSSGAGSLELRLQVLSASGEAYLSSLNLEL